MFPAANTGKNLKCPKIKEPVDMPTLWKITMLFQNIIMKTINYMGKFMPYGPKYQIREREKE